MEIPFQDYFGGRSVVPTNRLLDGDQLLVLRGGSVFRVTGVPNQAYASFDGNAAATPIAGAGVWAEISGTLGNESVTQNFTFNANTFTFNGPNQSFASRIRVAATLTKTMGSSNPVDISAFINGAPVGSIMSTAVGNGSLSYVATQILYPFQTGDTLKMAIRNSASADDIVVEDAQIVVG